MIDKRVYTATNPVQDHLVDRVHHWPGVNGLTALLDGRTLRARRRMHFFRPHGPMPDEDPVEAARSGSPEGISRPCIHRRCISTTLGTNASSIA